MEFIRNVLLLTLNPEWGRKVKDLLMENNKINVDIAGLRSVATKLISEKNFSCIIIEDSFGDRNISTMLRAFTTSNVKMPEVVIFNVVEFNLLRSVEIPTNLLSKFYAYSHPMPPEEFSLMVKRILLPYDEDTVKRGFDREFVEILVKACQHTFKGLGVMDKAKSQRPTLLEKAERLEVAIRGKIIIKSPFFSGSLLISFPRETYLNIYNSMTGSNDSEINESNEDFAGELANMVYGHSKATLEQQGVKLDMAIPVTDKSGAIKSKDPVFVIPFESELGPFQVKLALNHY